MTESPPQPLAEYISDGLPTSSVHINKNSLFFDKIHLAYPQWRILAYLEETPYVDAKALAKKIGYSATHSSAFWQYVDQLAEMGLVKFTGFPENGLLLMDKGRTFITLYKKVWEIGHEAVEEAKRLSKELKEKTAPKLEAYIAQMNSMIPTQSTIATGKLIDILKERFPDLSLDEAHALWAKLFRNTIWIGTIQLKLADSPPSDVAAFIVATVYGKNTTESDFHFKGWGSEEAKDKVGKKIADFVK